MDPRQNPELAPNTIPLMNAVLCADCEVISDSPGETCLVCGSRSLLSVGRLLGGSVGDERAVVLPDGQADRRRMFTLLLSPEATAALHTSRRKSGPELVAKTGA